MTQKNKKLSASSIRLQEFTFVGGLGKKGYDPDEVRDFLNQVAKYVEELEKKLESAGSETTGDTTMLEVQIEQLSEENQRLREELERLKRENEELKKSKGDKGGLKWEDIPEEILATEILKAAKDAGDRMIEEKKREAEEILRNAKKELEEIKREVEDAKKNLQEVERQRDEILSKLEEIKVRVRGEILSLAKKIEEFAGTI
ncbi:MAG: DivIVA domain-containing protein [candidate division WOR-3 bacterium]